MAGKRASVDVAQGTLRDNKETIAYGPALVRDAELQEGESQEFPTWEQGIRVIEGGGEKTVR